MCIRDRDDDARQRRYERARNKYREGIISGGEDERVHHAVYKAADEHGAHELDVQVQRALTRAHEPLSYTHLDVYTRHVLTEEYRPEGVYQEGIVKTMDLHRFRPYLV